MPDVSEAVLVQVASDDGGLRRVVCAALDGPGWEVVQTTESVTTLALAATCRPRVILLDGRDRGLVEEVVGELRADFRTMLVPLIFATEGAPEGWLVELAGAADDYLTTPLDAGEVVSRIVLCLRRASASRSLSPLTGLPGNVVISEELGRRLEGGRPFALLHADMDGFKQYNDRYGFERGDGLIRFLGAAVVSALESQAPGQCFAGHVGGDDFVAMVDPEVSEAVARHIVSSFDEGVGDFYDPADVERGWVEVADRRGERIQAPVCSVSVGIVFSARGFGSPAEMAQAAAEVKSVAKRKTGSAWALDRRRA